MQFISINNSIILLSHESQMIDVIPVPLSPLLLCFPKISQKKKWPLIEVSASILLYEFKKHICYVTLTLSVQQKALM